MKCSKFVAEIADFEEAYRDTLTRKMQFGAEFWTFRQASPRLLSKRAPMNIGVGASYVLGSESRLDYEQVLRAVFVTILG